MVPFAALTASDTAGSKVSSDCLLGSLAYVVSRSCDVACLTATVSGPDAGTSATVNTASRKNGTDVISVRRFKVERRWGWTLELRDVFACSNVGPATGIKLCTVVKHHVVVVVRFYILGTHSGSSKVLETQ